MKTTAFSLSFCSLALGAALHANQEDQYTNQILQIQYDETGAMIPHLVVVGTAGEIQAAPILFGVSVFELWSFKNDNPSQQVLLDTTEVNGYFSPEIWIDTPDPYDTFSSPRTRVDIPYSVRIEGVGEAYIDNAAGSLQFMVNSEDLPAGESDFPLEHETNFAQGTPINSLLKPTLTGSVEVVSSYVDQEWSGVWGRETFSLWEEDGTSTPMLSSRHVNIWPTASIDFTPGKAITDGATYRVLPEIEVGFTNLYAYDKWEVWLETADGARIDVSGGDVINGKIPQPRNSRITDILYDKRLKTGTYTLYASQQAPGLDLEPNVKNLGSFTFIEEIKVRANVVGSE